MIYGPVQIKNLSTSLLVLQNTLIKSSITNFSYMLQLEVSEHLLPKLLVGQDLHGSPCTDIKRVLHSTKKG